MLRRAHSLRFILLMTCCSLLSSSLLPVALTGTPPRILATPACPALTYPHTEAMLGALAKAPYACAEDLAAAIRARADSATVRSLITMAHAGADSRARRNALRTLGRLAESPRGSQAHELVVRAHGAATQSLVVAILRSDRDNFLLQDGVWLLDSFFYPSFGAASALEQVATDAGMAAALRYRAAAARARLLFAQPGAVTAADRAFLLNGLRAEDPGVRTAAANAIAYLTPSQFQDAVAELRAALDAAWAAEPALELVPDAPDARALNLFSFQESSPTSLSARAAIARAQDRLADGGTTRLDDLRHSYEALALPHELRGDGVQLRSGLPPEQSALLLAELERTRLAYREIVGAEQAIPLPDATQGVLTLRIFARQGIYRDYMRAFTPFSVDVDGIYDERTATIYTHQRTPEQSEHTLVETLRHELAHHYGAQTLFPGQWLTPGYHREPKGWVDEGLAELMAGLGPDGPAPRPAQLARLCERTQLPALGQLLARREGYDRFGSFDYAAAWALTYYLYTNHPAALQQLYASFRNGSYRLAQWEPIAGLPMADSELAWHTAIRAWCGGSAGGGMGHDRQTGPLLRIHGG